MYARAAHVTTRAAYIFHARWVILRGVDSARHSRERAGNRDAQSHDPKRSKQIKLIKQNSTRAVVSWRHSLFRASHGLMLFGGGEYKLLPFYLGTTYNACSMEDTAIS